MTPIVLPLVMGLVYLGISEPGVQPSADIWHGFAGSRYLPSVDTAALASAGDNTMSALSGSAYPEAYRWNQDEVLSAPAELGGPGVQARSPADPGNSQVAELEREDAPDNDFDLTPGVGLVGIGFNFRYR
jgi:hypothetical protein